MSFASEELRIAYADEVAVIGVRGPLIVMDWRGQVEAHHMAAIERLHHELLARYPEGTVGIHLTDERTRVPQGPDRGAAFELGRATAGGTLCVGVLIGAQGFVASALQSFAIGIFATFGRTKAKSFRELLSLCSWLSHQTDTVGDAAALGAAVDAVRQHEVAATP